ncbi:dTDP-4-dehydrorhamnose 3,5-epimerase [Candidatus Pelagibacter sp.]|nr:dTDP-4-dehydrorhamnose 3,5-epimerase [Candidatus Pelagibacter sp.]
MKILKTTLNDLYLIEPTMHKDKRGFFLETYNNKIYKRIITEKLVQDNFCNSKKNVLRGMHFTTSPQSQLVTILNGIVFDVFVDLRKNSNTYGKWQGFELNSNKIQQIFMPHGFAHGYCVLSDNASLHYKVSKQYNKKHEDGFIWNDATVGIKWPIKKPILSSRDENFKPFDKIK